ncbi:MAG: RNA polymerase sigma factor [Anaerolineales bacterium]
MNEQMLIQFAQQGDLESFNQLVLAYQDLIYTHAVRILGDSHAADDATQECFLSAFRSLATFRGGSFKAWLLRIITNQCYDELRRQKRHPTSALEPLNAEDEEIETAQWMVDPSESPEDQIAQGALRDAIQRCLDELPEEFRSVVVVVDMDGCDYAQAAQILSKPIGTIKSRLARARFKMQKCLQGFWELLPARFRLESEGKYE